MIRDALSAPPDANRYGLKFGDVANNLYSLTTASLRGHWDTWVSAERQEKFIGLDHTSSLSSRLPSRLLQRTLQPNTGGENERSHRQRHSATDHGPDPQPRIA